MHTIDPWHLIKGLKKKLNATAKKKGCEIIGKGHSSQSHLKSVKKVLHDLYARFGFSNECTY